MRVQPARWRRLYRAGASSFHSPVLFRFHWSRSGLWRERQVHPSGNLQDSASAGRLPNATLGKEVNAEQVNDLVEISTCPQPGTGGSGIPLGLHPIMAPEILEQNWNMAACSAICG